MVRRNKQKIFNKHHSLAFKGPLAGDRHLMRDLSSTTPLTHAMAANPAHAHSMHSNLGGMGVAGGAVGHHMSAHKIYEETQHHDASIYHEPYRCARAMLRKSYCERFPDLLLFFSIS